MASYQHNTTKLELLRTTKNVIVSKDVWLHNFQEKLANCILLCIFPINTRTW